MLDPWGSIAVTSQTDKQLLLFEVESGKLLCKVQCGELTTGMCFSNNNRHLITTSSLGVIYIWKLPESIQKLLNKNVVKSPKKSQTILDAIEEADMEDSVKKPEMKEPAKEPVKEPDPKPFVTPTGEGGGMRNDLEDVFA